MSTNITQWNFNSPTPDNATNTGTTNPAIGTGTANLLGTTATFAAGFPTGTNDNSGWNTTSYPNLGTGDRTEGVEFRVSTVGFESIIFNFDIRHSNTSANTVVVQYSTDGTNFVDFQTFTANQGDAWFNRNVDFSSVRELNNNPNAAFRVVAAFDPSLGNYRATTPTSIYSPNGTLRFDNVTFTGITAATTNPSVNLSVDPNSGTEAERTVITITAIASTAVSSEQTVDLTVTGGGITAGDYTLSNTRITIPSGQTTGTATLTIVDDSEVEGTETATISITNPSAGLTLGTTTSQNITIIDNDDVITPIYQIQGAGHTSPLVNQLVTTTGIVTAVDSNGFYLQDRTGDGNNATSDGIFVFTSSAPTVRVGDDVQVRGRVSEFFPGGVATGNLSTTQIGGSPTITVRSSGNPLPAATIIGSGGRIPPTANIDDDAFTSFDPNTDGIDFFESLEGMLVTAKDAIAVAGTNRFGEIFTVVDNGRGATGISQRGTLNISPNDFNPERVQIQQDTGILPGFTFPQVNVGARLGDVTGVVGYSFGNFEIYPTQAFTVTPATIQPKTTTLTGSADKLTVASYNVLNLDPNDNDADKDIADGRFDAIANQIVNNLKAPDIIGLQEIQDNSGSTSDGVIAADQTLQRLVDAIAAAGGPRYQFIDNPFIGNNTNGGEPGGNIRTAFLYNPARVSFVSGSLTAITNPTAQQTDSNHPFFASRLPLAGKFIFNGEEVTIVNNHFSSKGGSAPILGVQQPFEARQEDPTVNGSVDKRRAQAQVIKDYVDGILATDVRAKVVVLGDLNEFEFVSPIKTVLGSSLTNLTETLPENERYTFNFQGNSQSLDHILVSASLAENAKFDIVHVNSEFVETNQRASDHDPIIAQLDFSPQPQLTNYTFTNLPKLGTTSTGEDIFLGGFSGLYFRGIAANGNLQFVTHTDRGPNGEPSQGRRPFLLPSFQPEVISFELNRSTGEITITNRTKLFRPDGTTPLTGLPNLQIGSQNTAYTDEIGVDPNGNVLNNDPLGADLEGIVVAENGDFWMVDEYRPAIYHFNSAGKLIDRFIPLGTPTDASQNGGTNFGTPILPAVYAQRRANRGFEAVALEGNKLYAFIQSAIDNPDNTGDTVSRNSRNLRILEFDITTKQVTGEYLYLLDDISGTGNAKTDKIGDAVSLGNGKFAVVERDDLSTTASNKLIYLIDLAQATNINNPANFTLPAGKTIEQLTEAELTAANIRPVSKNLIANAAKFGYTGVEKLEGLALVAPNTLALINDNDFSTNVPNKLGLLELPKELPVTKSTPPFPNAIASGDTTQTSTVLWTRTSNLGNVTFEYATDPNFSTIVGRVTANATNPLQPVKVNVTGLTPNTQYYYRAIDPMGNTATGQFKTSAPLGTKAGFRFGVSGDWRGELGPYPAIANADERSLELFVLHGDTIYSDYPSPGLRNLDGSEKAQATTLDDFRLKHAEVYGLRFAQNTWGDLRSKTSILATIDDHEVVNDFQGGEDLTNAPAAKQNLFGATSGFVNDSPLYENGLQAFQEYNPLQDRFYGQTGDPRTDGERQLYRYNTFGSDAATFILDARSFRDPGLKDVANPTDPREVANFLAASFNPNRTMLGRPQLEDLKRDLLQAEKNGITWKFIMVPEPIQNLGVVAASDRFEGYAAERTEILKFINDNKIKNVVFVAADIHGTVVNNLTYQTAPGQTQIATNAFEITTGAVAFDAPFGPTVAQLALAAGLLTPQQKAFYDTLPVANDADDDINDKDDFIKNLVNQQLAALGYDPIGLNRNLEPANGLIKARLLEGDYIATHTYGWTEFDIDPVTQKLTVTTYGIDPYTRQQLQTNPSSVINRQPQIVSKFEVDPVIPVISTPPKLNRGSNDIFTISGTQPQLQVSLLGRSSNLVNELSVFTVDDAQGTINGIAPGQAGYTEAALQRARTVFSIIGNNPNGFNPQNLTRLLTFNPGDNLRFLLIKDGTLDSAIAKKTPLSNVLISSQTTQRITDTGNDTFTLSWEDGTGNSTDFKDLEVRIQATNQTPALGSNLQGGNQAELMDLRGITGNVTAEFTLYREAAFNNFVGFYRIADTNGGIDTNGDGIADILPGQTGYTQAAINQRIPIDLTVSNQSTAKFTTTLTGGTLLAPFIIANGRPEALLDNNPNNDPKVYFSFLGANPNQVDHIRLLGDNTWGFEDLPLGGDRDYNDVIMKVNLTV
ncbi:esterase-like activity of phytase family protein [Calothrix sp. NIES-3974]|uniref:esterase-like activity of phytase family protein n=1 Tax=Calothrix sp. NIES-3974 TaxID=2005462 RepID=UPI000B5E083F|nr:esterase-like activity of phytase family protein [Calothrix sp. NIES-3974]BAZ07476.1 hypothetical protein NIES3974_41390 [Calothrix sp. NIES-3974]